MKNLVITLGLLATLPAFSATRKVYIADRSAYSSEECAVRLGLTVIDTLMAETAAEYAGDLAMIELADGSRMQLDRNSSHRESLSDMQSREFVDYVAVGNRSFVSLERNSDRNYPRPNVEEGFQSMTTMTFDSQSKMLVCTYDLTPVSHRK